MVCEGFDNELARSLHNWAGIVFHRGAPYLRTQQFNSVFYNQSQSIMEHADVRHAGLVLNHKNKHNLHPDSRPLRYEYAPTSAIVVYQYAPRFGSLLVEHSAGNGLNYSNIEAPALVRASTFRHNRGHGMCVRTRFGNVTVVDSLAHANLGDGIKYTLNNTVWTLQEQLETHVNRYVEFCDSQNPLSYPAYYRFRNPNYVRECSKVLL